MNFYKHHLGDYDGATMHLSWDEDMAYSRMMRVYYRTEKPLPLEPRALYRLIRAATKDQRHAADDVLAEFFDKRADGWHHKRCDEEIAAANAQAETNRRIAEERENRKRKGNEPSTSRSRSVDETSTSTNGEREPIQTPDSNSQTPDTRHQTKHTHTDLNPQSRAPHNGHPVGSEPKAGKAKGSVCVESENTPEQKHAQH